MEFSRQEYWSRLPFPTPEDLPDPGMEPTSLVLPALAGGFFTTESPGKPICTFFFKFYFIFKLYIIVLVLPNIKMNPPQVYMCSPS